MNDNGNSQEIDNNNLKDEINELNIQDKSKLIDLMDESIHILKEVYIIFYLLYIFLL